MLRPTFDSSRWKLAWSMIRAMILVTVPAALSLWCLIELLDLVRADGGPLAWTALILLTPFTLILTALAVTVDFFSALGLIATLLTRKIKTVHVRGFGMQRTMRDVTPESAPTAQRLPELHPD